jgi:low temperature requirement protein LtrA
MRLHRRDDRNETVAGPVTSIELFFDLVFVFTVTRLTGLLGDTPGWAGLGQIALLLALMWWMYGGYAWLTNAVPPVTWQRQCLLLLGMTGNFVMALAVPHAFSTNRFAFAFGYLLVVGVHTFMYLTESPRVTTGMIVQLFGWNLLSAAMVVVGAVLGGDRVYAWWIGAVVVETVVSRLTTFIPLRHRRSEGPAFTLQPGHFVERHGLMLIIVLGESVLAIGIGVSTGVKAIGIAQVLFAAISLGLAATLFWAYFGTHEDDAAEDALASVAPEKQQTLALHSFGYALVVMLFGTIIAASGLHHALGHPLEPLPTTYALQLAGGVAVYWLGLGAFRLAIHRSGALLRIALGACLLATTLLGDGMSALVELLALVTGSWAILALEYRISRSRP